MKNDKSWRLLSVIIALSCVPSTLFAAAQCGGFLLKMDDGGSMTYVNGEQVTSQKIYFLGAKGDYNQMKMDMTLMPARDGNMYGYEFIKQNGKAFLNVELIRRVMEEPRIIGSFDCKRVPD